MSADRTAPNANGTEHERQSFLERIGGRFADFAERMIPDAFVFAVAATFLVIAIALFVGDSGAGSVTKNATSFLARLELLTTAWGDGFWSLLGFTTQMSMIVIAGYVVASAPLARRFVGWLAGRASSPRAAVALVAFVAMATSWLNWGFSLMFSAFLAREVAARVKGVDYRTVAAAAFLGLGSVWAQGLSGSAALQMATPGALPPEIRAIVARDGVVADGIVPLSSTIFLWQSFASVGIELVVITALVYFATPRGARARTAEDLGIDTTEPRPVDEAEGSGRTPGEFLDHRPWLPWMVALLAAGYLVVVVRRAPSSLAAITLDAMNLGLLALGLVLHRTPSRFMRAFKEATPAVAGILMQFPFYAGIALVLKRSGLSEQIADFFVGVSTPSTFPAVIASYSAVLGVVVPSGGGKWVIEAPYVIAAAHRHHVHIGWVVACYDLGEALANLVQPFWMLPILAVFKLRARDVFGLTMLVCVVLTPLVLALVTVLGATLRYPF